MIGGCFVAANKGMLGENVPARIIVIPDHFMTQEMCERAVEVDPWFLEYVPDHLKAAEMCDKAVEEDPYTLRFVLDPLKTQEV